MVEALADRIVVALEDKRLLDKAEQCLRQHFAIKTRGYELAEEFSIQCAAI